MISRVIGQGVTTVCHKTFYFLCNNVATQGIRSVCVRTVATQLHKVTNLLVNIMVTLRFKIGIIVDVMVY